MIPVQVFERGLHVLRDDDDDDEDGRPSRRRGTKRADASGVSEVERDRQQQDSTIGISAVDLNALKPKSIIPISPWDVRNKLATSQ